MTDARLRLMKTLTKHAPLIARKIGAESYINDRNPLLSAEHAAETAWQYHAGGIEQTIAALHWRNRVNTFGNYDHSHGETH